MGQFTQDGVVYEELPDGNVRVVGYAPGSNAVAPNQLRVAEKQAEVARQAEADARAARDQSMQEQTFSERNAPSLPAGYRWKGGVVGGEAEPIPGTDKTNGKPMPDGVAKRYEEGINAFAALDRAVNGFQDDYAGNSITGGLENTIQNVYGGFGTPGQAQWWSDFKATDNVLRNALYGASLTAGEKAAYEATTVSPRMDPEQVKANLARRMELARGVFARRTNFLKANGYDPAAVDALAGEYGQQLIAPQGQQSDDELGKAAAVADPSPPDLPPAGQGGNDPVTPWDGPEADMRTAASGGYRFVDDPRTRSTVAALINAGAGFSTVAAAAQKAGGRPMTLQQFNAVKDWMKKNPGKEYPASAVEAGQYVPLTLGQKIAGSPGGAFTAQMANSATAGIPGALAGERGKGALDAMAAANPNASLAGNVVGGITGSLGAELGVGSRLAGRAAERFAPRIADSLFGAATGFNNAADGEGLQDALTGAIVAPIGGAVGERAMRAVGSGVRGVVNPAVERLRNAGVPLTMGQAASQSGRLGNMINKTEQALTSLPGVGSMVSGRFDDGARGFNRAAFEVGAETTGNQVNDVGANGLAQLRQLVGNAYDDALHPGVRLDVTDPAVAQDLINSQMVASSIPQVGDDALEAINYRVTGGTGLDGTMDGRDFQEAYRGLGRDGRAAARSDTYAHEVQGAMGQAQDALAAGLEAQNPGAYAGFVNANTANRRAMVLADAVNAAKNQSDELFTPAQLNTADANSATRLTGRLNSAAGNRPFHQLAQDGQQVMGNRLPNSGTTDRAWTGLAINSALGGGIGAGGGYLAGDTGSGAGLGSATGLGLTLALMAGGTRTGQRALTGAILNRPAIARAVGEAIERNAQIGGGFGAGILTPLLVGPQ